MVTVRHPGMRWILAGLAMTGLAGAALAATDQPTNAGADPSASAVQSPDQQGPARAQARARRGGWDGPGGPQARRIGPQRWHRPGMRMRGRGFGESMLDRPLLLAFRRLDLTDKQWQRVQAILEVQQLRSGAGGTQEQRRAQVAALFNPGDPQHSQAVQAVKDRLVARIDQAAHTQQALYEVLTPAQQTRLQQLVTQRRERMRQRLQQRGERGAQQPGQGGDGAGAAPSGQ